MKYFKLELDMDRYGDVICYSNNSETDINTFCIAREETPPNENFRFFYNLLEGNFLTDILANDKGWFVVSRKFKEKVLDVVNCNVQFFRVTVECENDGTLCGEYYIANILSVVNALCLEGSDYSVFQVPGRDCPFYSVRKYCIYNELTENLDVFKLAGDHVVCIFCSEKVKDVCEHNGITGISFVEIRQSDRT